MNQLRTTKRKKKRNAKRVERLAKKANQTIRKTRINNPMKFPFTSDSPRLSTAGLITANPIHATKGQSQTKKNQDD